MLTFIAALYGTLGWIPIVHLGLAFLRRHAGVGGPDSPDITRYQIGAVVCFLLAGAFACAYTIPVCNYVWRWFDYVLWSTPIPKH